MLLKIYATGARHGTRAGGPSLVVDADDPATLPRHPTGQSWRYNREVKKPKKIKVASPAATEGLLAKANLSSSPPNRNRA